MADQLEPTAATAVKSKAGVRRWFWRGRKIPILIAAAAVWAFCICLVALLAPLLPLQDPNVPDYSYIATGPSSAHWLGTDQLGRDMLSRLICGARASLQVGFVAVFLGLSVGMILGLLAGFIRGRLDSLISVVADTMLAFPSLIFIMVLVAVRGPSLPVLIIGLGVVMVPTFTRLARASTLVWARRDFVTASKVLGARRLRTLARDVFPNVLPTLLAYAFVVVAVVMVAEGSLSFLGFGVQPPTPSWGSMIASGRQLLSSSPLIVFLPALFLLLTVLAFNLLGDFLRDRASGRSIITL